MYQASAASRSRFRSSVWYACHVFKQDLCQLPWSVMHLSPRSEVPPSLAETIPAQVPGCIHLDLIRAGVIKHPREGFAELDQFWVGKANWRYTCIFEPDAKLFEHDCVDLVCDGLDTIAMVELNANLAGRAANMFHPHRFRLTKLRHGENHLAVNFKSPLRHIREEEARLGARPVNGDWDPYIFIRKAAVNFGWDFAPKVPTCGIWKPLALEAWSGVRITGVRPIIRRVEGDLWRVSVECDLEWSDRITTPPHGLVIGVSLENHGIDTWGAAVLQHRYSKAVVSIDVKNPRLWWPNGHGEQPLYTMKLALQLNGEPYGNGDGWTRNIGFREVRLNTEPDEHGSKFQIEVNGKPIFCKGANWVPDALFPTEVSPEQYRTRVKQAADANMNMLRVWGGGYYEDEEFYRACDEQGILVWQDFMFACAMYPEEAPYPALFETEARHQITRLSSHPSVALWCGGNECVWAYESWGNAPGETPWKVRLGDKTWGRLYYFDLLPKLVAELDPTRPYWANSPWSGSESVPTNGQNHGDRHTWDVRMEGYRTIVPRFCSEFGQQAPAEWVTLELAIGKAGLALGSRELEHRQRATGGTANHIDAILADQCPPCKDFGLWYFFAQQMQMEALKTAIEWMRVQRPRCMGALVWQFNDAWPCLSWSLIDSDGRTKPAWNAVKSALSPRILTIQPMAGRPLLFGVNDTDEPWAGEVLLERRRAILNPLAEATIPFLIPPHNVAQIADVETAVGPPAEPRREDVMATSDDASAWWTYVCLKDFIPPTRENIPRRNP